MFRISYLIVLGVCIMGCSVADTQTIVIGYCPTMQMYVDVFDSDEFSFELISSSAVGFESLSQQKFDAIFVGRKPYDFEQIPFYEYSLFDRFTLVSLESEVFFLEDLHLIPIHTVYDMTFESYNLIFHQTYQDALSAGIAYIPWSEVTPDMRVVIVLDSDGKKVESFRNPSFYTNDLVVFEKLVEFE